MKEYKTTELALIWKPELCVHAGICVSLLPEVYDPQERSCVKPDNATTEQLIQQIDKCPSRALSYRF